MWFLLSPDHLVTVKQGDEVVLPVWSSGEAARRALASSTGTELLDLCCVTIDDWDNRWVPSLRQEKISIGTDWSNVHGGDVDSHDAA